MFELPPNLFKKWSVEKEPEVVQVKPQSFLPDHWTEVGVAVALIACVITIVFQYYKNNINGKYEQIYLKNGSITLKRTKSIKKELAKDKIASTPGEKDIQSVNQTNNNLFPRGMANGDNGQQELSREIKDSIRDIISTGVRRELEDMQYELKHYICETVQSLRKDILIELQKTSRGIPLLHRSDTVTTVSSQPNIRVSRMGVPNIFPPQLAAVNQ